MTVNVIELLRLFASWTLEPEIHGAALTICLGLKCWSRRAGSCVSMPGHVGLTAGSKVRDVKSPWFYTLVSGTAFEVKV